MMVAAWVAVALVAIFLRGEQVGIDQHVTNRLRFHAIPVAISVLYHGRAHDYTAFSSLAFELQYETDDFESKIAWAVHHTPPKGDPTYFWAADDRGMADYVLGAFVLFGPHGKSLYYFYFVVLTASVLLFLADLSWNRIGAAALILSLSALYVCLSVIPLGNLTVPVFEPGSLYEPRVIELLSFVATIHLALTALLSSRWTRRRIVIVAAQAAVFAFCYHLRSIIAWQLGFIVVVGIAGWAWRRYLAPDRSIGVNAMRISMPAMIPALCVLAGFLLVKGYERASYNPRYFSDLGSRTVWHNVLMGLGDNTYLAKKYTLGISDAGVVHALRKYLTETNDPRARADLSDNTVLGSFGGHSPFDWFMYEGAARDFYLHIWRADPRSMVRLYLVDKPHEILRVLVKAVRPPASLLEEVPDLGFRPFGLVAVALAAPAFVLVAIGDLAVLPSIAAVLVLFGFSVLPGFVFYSVVHTMIGVFASVSLGLFVVAAAVLAMVAQPVMKQLPSLGAEGQDETVVTARTREVLTWAALALLTLLVSGYFAPRGFRGGFTDMAHDGYQVRQLLDLAHGKTIFKGTFEQYGPIAPALNLGAFLMFGRTLLAVKYVLCLWYAATAVLMYLLSRRLLPRSLSVVSVLAWLALAPFYGHGIMLSPHAYVLFFQVAATLAVLNFSESDDLKWLVATGALCGICWGLKTLLGVFFVAGVTLYLAAGVRDGRFRISRGLKGLAAMSGGFAAVVVCTLAYLASKGAVRDWYLQTVVFPRDFYIDQAGVDTGLYASVMMFARRFIDLNFDTVNVPVALYWHLFRATAVFGGLWLWLRRRASDPILLLACLTPPLWLGAYPSANFMHQWWMTSLAIPSFVYFVYEATAFGLRRWDRAYAYTAPLTVVVVVATIWSGISERWDYAVERATILTETLNTPRVLSGIHTDSQTFAAFQAIDQAIRNFQAHHPSTRVVSIDHCDGYTNCVPESLLWLSFDENNSHDHPIYWPIPTLTQKVYPDYARRFDEDLQRNHPIVVDTWNGPFRKYNRVPGYYLLVGAETKLGYWYVFAPSHREAEAHAENTVRLDTPPASSTVTVDAESRERGFSIAALWNKARGLFRSEPSAGSSSNAVAGVHRRDTTLAIEGETTARQVYTWPGDAQLPVKAENWPESQVALRAANVSPNAGGWMVRGAAESRYSYLLQFTPRAVPAGTYFLAAGTLRKGGLTIGLLRDSKWFALVNVGTSGPFAAVLRPPPGRYEVVIANFLGKDSLENVVDIDQAGWIAPRAR